MKEPQRVYIKSDKVPEINYIGLCYGYGVMDRDKIKWLVLNYKQQGFSTEDVVDKICALADIVGRSE